MITINVAHMRTQGIDFAVFDADVSSRMDSDRAGLLTQLVRSARRNGLNVDKAALAFSSGGRVQFYGTPDLVAFLANNGIPQWTHTITV